MKKVFAIILCMSLLMIIAACASNAPSATPSSQSLLLELFEANPDSLLTVASNAFSTDPRDAPSDEELIQMLDLAMTAPSGHGRTPWQFIVIRDFEEQKKIFGSAGGVPTPGTVTVLVLSDNIATQENHVEPYTDWYYQSTNAYYDAGLASGVFNLAAYALGYGTHFYAGLGIPRNQAGVAPYLTSKDGVADFTHTAGLYTSTTAKELIAKGNLMPLYGIVIGKVRPGIDAASAATRVFRGKNYNFWDPQNGTAYGKGVPAGQLPSGDQYDFDAVSGATEW